MTVPHCTKLLVNEEVVGGGDRWHECLNGGCSGYIPSGECDKVFKLVTTDACHRLGKLGGGEFAGTEVDVFVHCGGGSHFLKRRGI